jgi:hypothetical protein
LGFHGASFVTARSALYPSYVDLDPMIDVAWLKALDGYIRERLERRLAAESAASQPDQKFYTGPFILDAAAPTVPGSRMVYLSQSNLPDDYYDLDRCEQWSPGKDAEEFSELMSFIGSLPFAATGRILIMYDPDGRAVTAHRDHDSKELCHEFFWLRTNLSKPFYMLDPGSGEKCYVEGYSAWFDTVNQYHGADATGDLCWSIRVDGRFSDDFRNMIPPAGIERSSSAAHWQRSLCQAG